MGYPLLHVVREEWLGSNRWGRMHLRSLPTGWEYLCFSYELPWLQDRQGNSLNDVSRITTGIYEMEVRADGPKGWRLELLGTGHRENIQVHRAATNLFIQGCILPVHFRPADPRAIPAAAEANREESMKLMSKIKERYEFLREVEPGRPEIHIAGTLPATGGSPGTMAV